MPDYEGLIRAVDEGLCLRPGSCREMSEAAVAAYIASLAAIKPAPIYMGSPPPTLTGEQVSRIVDSEFDLSCGWPRDCGEYPTDAMRTHAWDRVAAKLAKP